MVVAVDSLAISRIYFNSSFFAVKDSVPVAGYGKYIFYFCDPCKDIVSITLRFEIQFNQCIK